MAASRFRAGGSEVEVVDVVVDVVVEAAAVVVVAPPRPPLPMRPVRVVMCAVCVGDGFPMPDQTLEIASNLSRRCATTATSPWAGRGDLAGSGRVVK